MFKSKFEHPFCLCVHTIDKRDKIEKTAVCCAGTALAMGCQQAGLRSEG